MTQAEFRDRFATFENTYTDCAVTSDRRVSLVGLRLVCSWPKLTGFGYLVLVDQTEVRCLLFSTLKIGNRDRRTVGRACRTFLAEVTR